jgi:fibronectin-binding autotransporter adhesin
MPWREGFIPMKENKLHSHFSRSSAIALAALALWPAANLCAYSGGDGSSGNPYILDASDSTLSGGYYLATSYVYFENTSFYIGYLGESHLTVASGATARAAYSIEIGYWEYGTCLVDGGTLKAASQSVIRVGYEANGALTIQNGGTATCSQGLVGNLKDYSGNVTITGEGSNWTCSSVLTIGLNGTGTLDVLSGGLASCEGATIGDKSTGTGTVTVDGDSSKLHSSLSLYVGDEGSGTLKATGGGTVEDADGYINYGGGSGSVTLSDSGTSWTNSGGLYAGYAGKGTLLIESKASASAGGKAYIAYGSSSGGSSITVTGTDSALSVTGDLYIGYGANGSLDVESGAGVTSAAGYIAEIAGVTASATVSGTDSTWTLSGNLHVGYSGTGTLDIGPGGAVTSTNAYIGENAGGKGTVSVSGAKASWTIKDSMLYVGESGDGTLAISGGGNVTSYATRIADNEGSTGSITVSGAGSKFQNTGDLWIGYSGKGSMTLSGGAAVTCDEGYIGAYGTATGSTVSLTGEGTRWDVSSALYVGYLGSGTLTIEGGALVSADSLAMQSGSAVYLNGGYLAIAGDEASNFATLFGNGRFYAMSESGNYILLSSSNYASYVHLFTYNLSTDAGTYAALDSYALSGDYTIVTSLYCVPEPAAFALMTSLGASVLALFRRRAKRGAACYKKSAG